MENSAFKLSQELLQDKSRSRHSVLPYFPLLELKSQVSEVR